MYTLAIQSYAPATHFDHLLNWVKYRDLPQRVTEQLPQIGYFVAKVNDRGDTIGGVAAGFLRRMEGQYGMIDGYITNPTCSPTDRNEALDLLTATIVTSGKSLGIHKILSFSVDDSIIERAKRHGFAQHPHTFLVFEG